MLVTVSDKKPQHSTNNTTVDYYNADVVTANDYYPFGMGMPGRSYINGSEYRYGFNGKENDNEVKGEGNQQDYGMRIYDPRLGRFLSRDPLTAKYPMLTPYQFASNRPIDGIDLDGLEWASSSETVTNFWTGQSYIKTTNYVKLKVINESTIITNPDIIKAKAELMAKDIEKTMSTVIQIPMEIPNEVIVTKVILDFTQASLNDLPTNGKLIFDDRKSTTVTSIITSNGVTTTNPEIISEPGVTKGVINGFDIRIGVTMDGNMVADADIVTTGSHEAIHSAGGRHPWTLSAEEKQYAPNINQHDPIFGNKNDIQGNIMNSAENPDPKYRKNSGKTFTNGQLKAVTERIKQQSAYAPDEL